MAIYHRPAMRCPIVSPLLILIGGGWSGLAAEDESLAEVPHVSSGAGAVDATLGGGQGDDSFDDATALKQKDYKPVEIAAVPYPTSDPTLGVGITALALAAVRRSQQDNRPITIAAAGMVTENGSWGAAGGIRAPLCDDDLRVLAGGGYAHLNTNFYGIGVAAGERGTFVPISQDVAVGLLGALFKVADDLYVGPRVSYNTVTTRVDVSSLSIPPSLQGYDLASEDRTASLGVQAEWDTRDNTFYPSRGWYITGSAVGSELDKGLVLPGAADHVSYYKCSFATNRYWMVTPKSVLAMQVKTDWRSSQTPFYALASVGSSLRGYVSTQYQDRTMVTAQAEYRYDTGWHRIGATAFTGVGAIAPTYADLLKSDASDLLPAIGAGLRWTVAPENHINIRFDTVYGRDGTVWYLSVGEAY